MCRWDALRCRRTMESAFEGCERPRSRGCRFRALARTQVGGRRSVIRQGRAQQGAQFLRFHGGMRAEGCEKLIYRGTGYGIALQNKDLLVHRADQVFVAQVELLEELFA